jgi:hypothetical protein
MQNKQYQDYNTNTKDAPSTPHSHKDFCYVHLTV